LLVLVFLGTFSFAHMEQSLALFLGLDSARGGRNWTELEIGYAFGTVGLLGAFVQGGLIRKLSKKYSDRGILLTGWLLLAVGLAMVGVFGYASGSFSMLVVGAVLVAFGQGLSNPSISALVSRCAPASAQGKAFGANQSMNSLARVLGPISTGWVGKFLGPSAPLFVAATGTGLALVILWMSGVRAPEDKK
jgi:MFS family permease